MKRIVASLIAALALAGCGVDSSIDPETGADLGSASSALSGAHYNLNIIGVAQGKTASMTGNNGGRIFVWENGRSIIDLQEGPTFNVVDANATDSTPAKFQLPNPDPLNTGTTRYSVFARALGKPGGSSKTTTCAVDPTDGQTYCSVYSAVEVRGTGKSKWDNVSQELLYIYQDLDGDGKLERYPLFDSALQDYFWQYDNNGLKLLQLRFYEQISTTVANP